tara:strand:- start:292754 stop:293566 length:813 start_codon:yes stop_codon:yes gene_type:complete
MVAISNPAYLASPSSLNLDELRSAPEIGVESDHVQITARYSSTVLFFKVGDISVTADLTPTSYRAETTIRAAGLAALFADIDIQADVSGLLGPGGAAPERYGLVNTTPSKSRSVEMRFPEGVAVATATPPFGSLGDPPASEIDRTQVLDPMTAFFILSGLVPGIAEANCSGSLPVFDGKQRYEIRLRAAGTQRIRTEAWSGEARICEAWYFPVSGYDPEDYPTEREMRYPLLIWLATFADNQIQIPVRIFTRAGLGGVTIEARSIELTEG